MGTNIRCGYLCGTLSANARMLGWNSIKSPPPFFSPCVYSLAVSRPVSACHFSVEVSDYAIAALSSRSHPAPQRWIRLPPNGPHPPHTFSPLGTTWPSSGCLWVTPDKKTKQNRGIQGTREAQTQCVCSHSLAWCYHVRNVCDLQVNMCLWRPRLPAACPRSVTEIDKGFMPFCYKYFTLLLSRIPTQCFRIFFFFFCPHTAALRETPTQAFLTAEVSWVYSYQSFTSRLSDTLFSAAFVIAAFIVVQRVLGWFTLTKRAGNKSDECASIIWASGEYSY